jgi:hypothetical protein
MDRVGPMLDAFISDPRIEALLANRCEFGYFYFLRPKECGADGVRTMRCEQEFQVCDGHFRWASDQHCTDPCLPAGQ